MKKILTLVWFFTISQNLFSQAGNLDLSFKSGLGANKSIYSIVALSNGKTIIAGAFDSYNGIPKSKIARLNIDGSLDTTFKLGFEVYGGEITNTVLQSDGKIIIGGSFYPRLGDLKNICRLNSDGSIDTNFNIGTSTDGSVTAIAIQSDGKIIVAGTFNKYNGVTKNRILRLNSNGTLDENFDAGADFGSADAKQANVKSISIQSDGKIVVVGYFKSINNEVKNNIARLNSDGSLDNNFSSGTGTSDVVNQIIKLSNGKFIIVGSFNFYNNTAANGIARLNADGTFDNTFNPGTGIGNNQFYIFSINSACLLNNNKLMIGGTFFKYNDIEKNNLARLNEDGSLDAIFHSGKGTDQNGLGIGSPIYAITPLVGNKILIGGSFIKYNDTTSNGIARIYNNEVIKTGLESVNINQNTISIYPNPATNFISINASDNIQSISLLNHTGQLIESIPIHYKKEHMIATDHLAKGIYFIQVASNDFNTTHKIIIE